jgi:hypothetical protein
VNITLRITSFGFIIPPAFLDCKAFPLSARPTIDSATFFALDDARGRTQQTGTVQKIR